MQEPQEMQSQSLVQEDTLEEEMATRSSILAWKIPWTEEPGRLQVKRLQSWTQSWTQLSTHAHLCVCVCIGGHGDVKAYNNNSLNFLNT